MNGLKERFRILIEGGVVTPEAADIAQRAVERLTARHGRFPAEQVEHVFHAPCVRFDAPCAP